tara:strand:+ start:82 stop:402 length:321 start_codon:yes stop_codon:yes gene_type:complete
MRVTAPLTALFVLSLSWANDQSLKAVAESAIPNTECEKFLRRLEQVRENFESADEDEITRGQFRVFADANAEIDFAMSKQIKNMRAYQRAFSRVDLDRDGFLSWDS